MILTKETLSAGPKIGTGEGVAHSKRWYVALVRMHHEKKVAERLDKMGIENFVPVQQEVHQWSDIPAFRVCYAFPCPNFRPST
jgi:hypothetical protein